jgi:hypothetical protein
LTFDIVYLQGIDFVLNSFGSYVMWFIPLS